MNSCYQSVKYTHPLDSKCQHFSQNCCINGHFILIGQMISEFESNCLCTCRNLVDWSTRTTWINSELRYQMKLSEEIQKDNQNKYTKSVSQDLLQYCNSYTNSLKLKLFKENTSTAFHETKINVQENFYYNFINQFGSEFPNNKYSEDTKTTLIKGKFNYHLIM